MINAKSPPNGINPPNVPPNPKPKTRHIVSTPKQIKATSAP